MSAAPPSLYAKAQEHLRLLSIFHYIVGGLAALGSCIFLLYLGIGVAMLSSPSMQQSLKGDMSPQAFGWLFIALGIVFFLVGETIAVCIILAGRKLAQRTNHTFVFVIACLECLFMPFGTALGIFSIITLSKPEVKALFAGQPAPQPLPPTVFPSEPPPFA
jgi:hypothetical protein